MVKVIWSILPILIVLSGFRIRVNENYFEWVGLLEQIYNCFTKRYKKQLEYNQGELELLKHNYDLVSHKYFEMVNSEDYKLIKK
ncbi:hypothetical protein [Metaclostridioides mangenotii]|uniref:hypothetical protein n=1 Tax=Metaclostridioides mangenotii TaxID=1540 RepID=UPI0028E2BBC3|nr:hypothetical protein [Clostridioides mangenotii]